MNDVLETKVFFFHLPALVVKIEREKKFWNKVVLHVVPRKEKRQDLFFFLGCTKDERHVSLRREKTGS